MAWVKLDDQFFRHPKVVSAGREARDLYLAGLCYCGSALTDGRIPIGAIRILAADADIDDGAQSAAALVRVGLWEVSEDGYLVHDYLEYNPTREVVQDIRAKRAEAGRLGGVHSGESRREANAKQNASDVASAGLEANAKQNRTPSKSPSRPTPVNGNDPREGAHAPTENVSKSPPPPIYSDDFLTFWNQYPTGHGSKKLAFDAWGKLKPNAALQADMLAGLAKWNACDQWQRGFVTHAERFLKNRMWEDEPPIGAVSPQSKTANGFGPKGPDAEWFANKARELERQGL